MQKSKVKFKIQNYFQTSRLHQGHSTLRVSDSMSFGGQARFKLHDSSFGFTLIETIVAIGVISVGLVGSLVLLAQSSAQASVLRNRVIAANLAGEGIEIIRNIRDSNWLAGRNWRDGLNDTASGLLNYNSTALSANANTASWCLNYAVGFHTHALPPDYICNTTFKRHIVLISKNETINPGGGPQSVDYLEVQSIVEWQEKTQSKSITAIDHLYDWK